MCFTMESLFFVITFAVLSGVADSAQVLMAIGSSVRIIDVEDPSNFTVIADNLKQPAYVDFLYSQRLVFWSDTETESIYRAVIDSSEETIQKIVTTTGLTLPEGLACDWIGHNLYWADSERKKIEVSRLDGSQRKVLYWKNIAQPRALVLDPFKGHMFWTDWGESPRIERAGMNGSPDTRTVIIYIDIDWPNGLTVDLKTSTLYWIDAKLGAAYSCDYQGTDRKTILKGDGIHHPFSLTMYKQTLYWADWQTNGLHSFNKKTGERKLIFKYKTPPQGIRAYMAQRQPPGPNPCDVQVSGCSSLCLISPKKPFYQCACPTGIKLHSDGKTCFDGPTKMLFVLLRNSLRFVSLDTEDFTDMGIPLMNISHGVALGFDPVDDYLYWTDNDAHGISRARIDGTEQENIIGDDIFESDGIVVDVVGRNIFWSDTGKDTIEVARLDGAYRKTIVSEGLDEPRALCLFSSKGLLYWTDWGKVPKIERAHLDGFARVTLITSGLGWPNGIVCDEEDDVIIWADAKTDRIEVADFEGTNRRILIGDKLHHVFGLSLLGDFIFWTDWQDRKVYRADKRTGKKRTVILSQLPDLMTLQAAATSPSIGTNACSFNNGGCSYLCLYTPNGAQCLTHWERLGLRNGFLFDADSNTLLHMYTGEKLDVPIHTPGELQSAYCIDYDYKDQRIYWIASTKTIRGMFMNGSTTDTVISSDVNDSHIEYIAVDWLSHNIYWIDSRRSLIEMSRPDGSSRRIVVWKDLNDPLFLVLDPSRGFMYWMSVMNSSLVFDYRIERAHLDGNQRTTIVTNIGLVIGFTIDVNDKRLYWSVIGKESVGSADLDGRNIRTLYKEPTIYTQKNWYNTDLSGKDMSALHDMYWTKLDSRHLTAIESAHETYGENQTTHHEQWGFTKARVAMYALRQTGSSACLINNGGCSHLCIPVPPERNSKKFVCACPAAYTLDENNGFCKAPPPFLLVGQTDSVYSLSLNRDMSMYTKDVLLSENVKGLRVIEFDPWNDFLYWLSSHSKTIMRTKLDGNKETQTIIQDSGIRPFDITLDAYSQTLFWSCLKKKVISFARIGATGQLIAKGKVIVEDRPRHIALNPEKGELFWTSAEKRPSIRKSFYDGTNLIKIITSNIVRLGPIAVDVASDQLFFSDLKRRVIEVSSLSGENRRTLLQDDFIADLVSVAVMDNDLYFATDSEIRRMETNTSHESDLVSSYKATAIITSIRAAPAFNEMDLNDNPCADYNGNCSHLCIPGQGSTFRCACPRELVLNANQMTCSEKLTCRQEEFRCTSGDMCIPKRWRCDGTAECSDHSDEAGCEICNVTQYNRHFCEVGQCKRDGGICNSRNDQTICIPCGSVDIKENFCYAEFVLTTKVIDTKAYINGDKRLILSGMMSKLYKGNSSIFVRYGNPVVKSKSECGCKVGPTVGRTVLFMGVTDNYINYVTYITKVTDNRQFRRSLKEMRRGFDCTKYQVTPVYKDWSAILLRNPDEM